MEPTSPDATLERMPGRNGPPAIDDGNALGAYERRVLVAMQYFTAITAKQLAVVCFADRGRIFRACNTLYEKGMLSRYKMRTRADVSPWRYTLPGWTRDMRPIKPATSLLSK